MARKNSRLGGDERKHRFEVVFRASYSRVFSYVFRRSQDRELSEDIVAETFLIAWRRLEDVPREPVPWLLGTARRVLANHRRYVERRSRNGSAIPLDYVDLGDLSASPFELIAERQAFTAAFAAVRAEDREVLALIAWEGLSAGEAAEVLGCTKAAFSIRLHRARRRLLKEMALHGHSLGEETKQLQACSRSGAPEKR